MTSPALPHSTEAEVAVLGAVLIERQAATEVRSILGPEDFFRASHRLLYEAMLRVYDRGAAIDVLTLADELKGTGHMADAGGYEYLAALVDAVPTASNVTYHARIVADKAARRRLIEACQQTALDAAETEDADALFTSAQQRLLGATARKGGRGFRHVAGAVMDALALAEKARESADGITGIRTGIPRLDRMTSGLEPGGLTVVAGRPGMGKSALGWQLAERAAMDGHGVTVASYEMADAQLGRRGLARLGNLDANLIRSGRMSPGEWQQIDQAARRLSALPIWTHDQPPHEVEGLRAMIHRHQAEHPTALVCVDYLQQMSGPKGAGNRNNEVEHISRGLKRMAMELGVHVVALAQLSRGVEHRTPPRPVLSDLRDSGAIEQDADNVLLLWRPEYYFDDSTPDNARAQWQGRAELILAKQRDGETGRVLLAWDGPRVRFTELDERRAA